MSHRMLGKRLRHLASRAAAKEITRHFFQALGIAWLILEVAAFAFPAAIDPIRGKAFWMIVTGGFLWSLGRSLPPLSYRKKFRASNVSIEISTGDLFTESSSIAFGCSECFDTESITVIGSKSLMAQLVREHFRGNQTLLDDAIISSLSNQNISGTLDPEKNFGKKIRFPIGTVAVIPAPHGKIFLVAFSRTKDDRTTVTSKEDLWASLCALWAMFKKEGFMEPIAVPLFGAGLAGVPVSRVSLTQLLILSFIIASREMTVSRKLKLVINEGDYDPEEISEAIELLKTLDF